MNTQQFLQDLNKRLPVIADAVRGNGTKAREDAISWLDILHAQVTNLIDHGDTQDIPAGMSREEYKRNQLQAAAAAALASLPASINLDELPPTLEQVKRTVASKVRRMNIAQCVAWLAAYSAYWNKHKSIANPHVKELTNGFNSQSINSYVVRAVYDRKVKLARTAADPHGFRKLARDSRNRHED